MDNPNFWQFLTNVFSWLEARTTRILAVATGTLVTLTGTGIVPERHLKYYMAAIALLTYWRGQAIATTVSAARAVLVKDNPSTAPIAELLPKAVPPLVQPPPEKRE